MKKLIAAAALALTLAAGAFAAGSVKSNDCTVGKYTSAFKVNGFSFNPVKGIDIEDKAAEPIKNGDVSYTKRIKTKGIDDYISFKAKKGEKVSIVATSGSKDNARVAGVVNAKNKKIGTADCPAWNMADPKFSSCSIEIPEDGEYKVKSTGDGGLYIFEIVVK